MPTLSYCNRCYFMKAYLDNNIIVSIENGDYSVENINTLFPGESPRYYYSSAHIYEIETFQGSFNITKADLLSSRFETIRNIFRNNYIYLKLNGNTITNIIEDPQIVFNTITETSLGISSMKGFVNLFTKEQKQSFREQMGIEPIKINNYNSTEIIAQLQTKLSDLGSMSFMDLIEHAVKLHPDGKSFGLHNRIAALFELLDMVGYWKDKETSTSNYARLWDSSHAFYATYCDYFVSDDKRTRNKAKVAYDFYNKKTKIISSRDKITSTK